MSPEETIQALKERGVMVKVLGVTIKQKKKVKKLDERISSSRTEK
jgi:hypothetical protein